MKRILVAVGVLAALTLTGCSNVIDGTGNEATSTGFPTDDPTGSTGSPTDSPTDSPTPSPTTSSSGPSPKFSCPDITYAGARMSFNCISNAMKVSTSGKIFTITMAEQVESGSGWQMEMGAKFYTGTETSFTAISAEVRRDLLDSGAYGTDPDYSLNSVAYSTISGKKAYTTADTVVIDRAYAASKKSKVRTEKRWLVIIEVEPGRYTLWFASIPDIASQFWPQVPVSIASIKINE